MCIVQSFNWTCVSMCTSWGALVMSNDAVTISQTAWNVRGKHSVGCSWTYTLHMFTLNFSEIRYWISIHLLVVFVLCEIDTLSKVYFGGLVRNFCTIWLKLTNERWGTANWYIYRNRAITWQERYVTPPKIKFLYWFVDVVVKTKSKSTHFFCNTRKEDF